MHHSALNFTMLDAIDVQWKCRYDFIDALCVEAYIHRSVGFDGRSTASYLADFINCYGRLFRGSIYDEMP